MVSPDSRAHVARRQAEVPLSALCKKPSPALTSASLIVLGPGVAVVSIVCGWAGGGRRDEQIKIIQRTLGGVVDVGAGSQISVETEGRKAIGLLDPVQVMGWEVFAMLAEQIYAVPNHVLECLQVAPHVQPGLDIAQLLLRTAELNVFDVRACKWSNDWRHRSGKDGGVLAGYWLQRDGQGRVRVAICSIAPSSVAEGFGHFPRGPRGGPARTWRRPSPCGVD